MLRLGSKRSFKFRGRHPACTGSSPGPPVLSHCVLTAASLILRITIISRYFPPPHLPVSDAFDGTLIKKGFSFNGS